MTTKKFQNYVQFVIVYIVFVIVWGAYVRASGSGAGCGSHWPLCNGVIIPQDPGRKTMIEFFHRFTSGLSLPLVLGIGYWATREFPKVSFGRKVALWASFSIILEALIGAGLVLFELVSHDQSIKRVVSICLHFTNTLFLTGTLLLTYQCTFRRGKGWEWKSEKLKKQSILFSLMFLLIGMAGAITALGDTLFPAQSLAHGLTQDWDHSSHIAIRLRVLHPILACIFGLFYCPWVANLMKFEFPEARITGNVTLTLVCFNILLGILNIIWLAPVGLQLLHLGVGIAVWMSFVAWVDQLAFHQNKV